MINQYIINQGDKIAEILLYGYIGSWSEIESKAFIQDLKKLETTNSIINVRINSGGGDVFQGISIYNALKNSPAEIHIYIDGLAASMASVIALAGDRIFMSRFAQLMIHKVSGNANGDSDKLRETANLMDELEASLLNIYSERTGKDIPTIQSSWMQRGKDSWFNAKDAIKENLIDEIVDGLTKKLPSRIKSTKDVWEFYHNQIENNYKPKNMETISQFISFYNLKEDASTQEILAAMQNQVNLNQSLKDELVEIQNENVAFKNQLQVINKQKIADLINNAIKANQITESQRSTYTTLAEANYDATKAAIEAITPYRSITSQLQFSETEDEYKTFVEYQKKAPTLLAQMKSANPAKYSTLFEKQYGKKPNLN